MKRRDALRAVLALASCGVVIRAVAQTTARAPLLGLLYPNPGSAKDSPIGRRLKELGWIEGVNLRIVEASSEGNNDRLAELAADLVRKRVDVIWVAGPEAAVAAARATRSIPIAFYGVAYPVEWGLVDSLARPGRNVTGLASAAGDEKAKRLELLREVVPTAKRLAVIATASTTETLSGSRDRATYDDIAAAATALGFEARTLEVSRPDELDAAFAQVRSMRAQAVFFDATALTFRERRRIAEFALSARLPSVGSVKEFVEAGGLLSYGADRTAMIMRSFDHVDRLLRGARPTDLPVELPSKFEITVNSKTARALGVSIPRPVLLRADQVIE
jgi:putative ABC transport system substrate-binding protein